MLWPFKKAITEPTEEGGVNKEKMDKFSSMHFREN